MSEPNEINRIFLDDNITITSLNMTAFAFSAGKILPKSSYSIADKYVTLNEQVEDFLQVKYFPGKTNYFEYSIRLYSTKEDRSISIKGKDKNNNTLSGLLEETVLIFANGKKLTPDQYDIISDGQVKLYVQDTSTQFGTVIIYTSPDIIDMGSVKEAGNWNPQKQTIVIADATLDRYLFFFNNKLIDPRNTTLDLDGTLRFDFKIGYTDTLEYYRLPANCTSLLFDADPGFFSYGPKDVYNIEVPDIYDTLVTFDKHIARLAIDDLRKGFFIRELDSEGCLMIVDDDFEHPTVKCLTVQAFKKDSALNTEYYVQVPNAKSITYYLSHFDLSQKLLPELLTTFQTLLLNETYDSIQRLKNQRSLTKIDSETINQLIKFLGFNQKLTDMPLEQKHALLEELNNFYRKVGTRTSYNFYNVISENSKIIDIEQLFTPIKDNSEVPEWRPNTAYAAGKSILVYHDGSTYYCIKSHTSASEWNSSEQQYWALTSDDVTEKRYVTFYSAEDLGAEYKQEYRFPFDDYGKIGQLANATDILSNYPSGLGKLQDSSRIAYCWANDTTPNDGDTPEDDMAWTKVVTPTGEWNGYVTLTEDTVEDWHPDTFYYGGATVVVKHDGVFYFCKENHTSASTWDTLDPVTNTQESDYWSRTLVKPIVTYITPNGFITDTVVGPNTPSDGYDYGYVMDFEYSEDLSKGNTLIEGEDMYGNELNELRLAESQIFINTRKLEKEDYQILSPKLLFLPNKYYAPQTIFMMALNFTSSDLTPGYNRFYYFNALNSEDTLVYTENGEIAYGKGAVADRQLHWRQRTNDYAYYVIQNGVEVIVGTGTREGQLDRYIRSDIISCPYSKSLWAFTGLVKTKQEFDVTDYNIDEAVLIQDEIVRLTDYIGTDTDVVMPNGKPQERTYYVNPEEYISKSQGVATVNVYYDNGQQVTWGPSGFKVIGEWSMNNNGTPDDIKYYALDTHEGTRILISKEVRRDQTNDINTEKEEIEKTKVIIWKSSMLPTNNYNYGYVWEAIKGEWVEWFEWDRPAGWYPTNHVDVSLEVPSDVDYDTFVTEFKKTFYDIASTVLYIHSIINVYNFKCGENNFGIMTAPTYHTIEVALSNDPSVNLQPH